MPRGDAAAGGLGAAAAPTSAAQAPTVRGTLPADAPAAGRFLARLLASVDRLFDALYGARWNPLHQSGNLATWCFLVSLVSGLYLFLFYRVGDPYASVVEIEREVFLGSLVRSLHRLSAELAMVAIVLHLVRKLAQGHTWGPRAFAWISGLGLLALVLVCGWSGLIMVWDVQALEIATQGSRLLDLFPVLSQPMARAFTGEAPIPSAFFFMNLFLHVALPLGLAAGLWLHVSRVARPAWLPPRPLRWALLGALVAVSAVIPAGLAPEADPFALAASLPLDGLYAFWLPVARRVAPPVHLALWLASAGLLVSVPWWWRPRRPIRTSWVDPNHCTGCDSCTQDCPYEAIRMVPRSDGPAIDTDAAERAAASGRSALVALVDPTRCVGCGICAGSCAPMGVGPVGWTGRDQLAAWRTLFDPPAAVSARPAGALPQPARLAASPAEPAGALLGGGTDRSRSVLVLGCRQAVEGNRQRLERPGVALVATDCSGSLHTSVLELALKSGWGGVAVLTCSPRACLNREGPKWLAARVFAGREAELKPRVDRRRLRLAAFTPGAPQAAEAAIAELLATAAELAPPPSGPPPEVEPCPSEEWSLLAAAATGSERSAPGEASRA
jgi:ferredoxin